MLNGPPGPVPWDILVFVTITTVGFGFSVQTLMNKDDVSPIASEGIATPSKTNYSSRSGGNTLDLGCLERKIIRERIQNNAGVIKIRGKFCHLTPKEFREFKGVSVKNLTTGMDGTIFFQGTANSFVTNDLQIQSGKNLILVSWRESEENPAKEYVAEVYGL